MEDEIEASAASVFGKWPQPAGYRHKHRVQLDDECVQNQVLSKLRERPSQSQKQLGKSKQVAPSRILRRHEQRHLEKMKMMNLGSMMLAGPTSTASHIDNTIVPDGVSREELIHRKQISSAAAAVAAHINSKAVATHSSRVQEIEAGKKASSDLRNAGGVQGQKREQAGALLSQWEGFYDLAEENAQQQKQLNDSNAVGQDWHDVGDALHDRLQRRKRNRAEQKRKASAARRLQLQQQEDLENKQIHLYFNSPKVYDELTAAKLVRTEQLVLQKKFEPRPPKPPTLISASPHDLRQSHLQGQLQELAALEAEERALDIARELEQRTAAGHAFVKRQISPSKQSSSSSSMAMFTVPDRHQQRHKGEGASASSSRPSSRQQQQQPSTATSHPHSLGELDQPLSAKHQQAPANWAYQQKIKGKAGIPVQQRPSSSSSSSAPSRKPSMTSISTSVGMKSMQQKLKQNGKSQAGIAAAAVAAKSHNRSSSIAARTRVSHSGRQQRLQQQEEEEDDVRDDNDNPWEVLGVRDVNVHQHLHLFPPPPPPIFTAPM
jgi:hypothetical protein